jgi:hypothetical protein
MIRLCDSVSKCLSDFIRPHIRNVEWQGKPTGLDRFLQSATKTIAYYIQKCEDRPHFDRPKARELLEKAAQALQTAASNLNDISAWNELALYLRDVYLSDRKDLEPRTSRARSKKWDKACAFYEKNVAPSALSSSLSSLEAVVSLAAERVTLQPGDHQRNEAAEQFAEDMIFAWICGTGEIPACATLNGRSKNASAFAAMLTKINDDIFKGTAAWSDGKHPFFSYAQTAKKKVSDLYPELVRRPQKRAS